MSAGMKALLSHEATGIDGLAVGELPIPEPGKGQVRIKVQAVGVNFPDVLLLHDLYQFKPPRPFAPGSELAGVVDKLGADVNGPAPGTPVLGWTLSGAMAEYVLVPENQLHPIPATMPMAEAAGLMMTYGTALLALEDRARLSAGEVLLVLGAAGGVGVAAVEIGHALGAEVIAAVSSEEKARFALESGANRTIVYPTGEMDQAARRELANMFKQACGEKGADVIADPVGGDYSEAALRAIAWHGRFLVVGFPAGVARLPLNLPLLKSCQIVGVFLGGEMERDPETYRKCARRLIHLYERGSIRPKIDHSFPLDQGGLAIRHLEERRVKGKVVVTLDG
jgi:NADPH2:quinone reductase